MQNKYDDNRIQYDKLNCNLLISRAIYKDAGSNVLLASITKLIYSQIAKYCLYVFDRYVSQLVFFDAKTITHEVTRSVTDESSLSTNHRAATTNLLFIY